MDFSQSELTIENVKFAFLIRYFPKLLQISSSNNLTERDRHAAAYYDFKMVLDGANEQLVNAKIIPSTPTCDRLTFIENNARSNSA